MRHKINKDIVPLHLQVVTVQPGLQAHFSIHKSLELKSVVNEYVLPVVSRVSTHVSVLLSRTLSAHSRVSPQVRQAGVRTVIHDGYRLAYN